MTPVRRRSNRTTARRHIRPGVLSFADAIAQPGDDRVTTVGVRRDPDGFPLGRAVELAGSGARRILGITGPPGAGKSTLAGRLVAELGDRARLVPMDGFHLADAQLERLGRRQRKGAIDTFDAGGYLALLRRLRENREPVVYAPEFRREIEEPIAGAIAVPQHVPLVVTEGNYLLAEAEPWGAVRELLDDAWYVALDEGVRLDRLIRRHIDFGKPPDAARAWATGTDQRNAELVARTRARADLVIVAR
jgi:pantothenate kinase